MHTEFDMDYFHEYDNNIFTLLNVEDWVERKIQKYHKMLHKSPILNDRDEDITKEIDAMLRVYIEVKSYIERGKKGYTD